MNIKVEFSLNELRALQQLIHFGVQARGLEVAEAAVVINSKIVAAMTPQGQQNLVNPLPVPPETVKPNGGDRPAAG